MSTPIGPDVEAALIEGLRAHAGLTALVAAVRIAHRLPADTPMPYVTVAQLGGRSPSAAPRVDQTLVQFDVWAGSSAQGSLVARTLRAALVDLHNTVRAGTVLSISARTSPAYLPDRDYTPARDRYIVEAVVTAHVA